MIGAILWYALVAVVAAVVVLIVGIVVLLLAYFFVGLVGTLFPSKNPNCRKDR